MKHPVNDDGRKWRNAFYGLPAAYKPAPSWDSCWDKDNDCRPTNVDAKALWASMERSRKHRVTA